MTNDGLSGVSKTSWLRNSVANLRPASIGVLMGATAFASMATNPADAQTPQQQPPNILVIMADDIGYWNVSAYNRGLMGYRAQTSIALPTKARFLLTITDSNPAPPAAQRSSLARARCARAFSKLGFPVLKRACRTRTQH